MIRCAAGDEVTGADGLLRWYIVIVAWDTYVCLVLTAIIRQKKELAYEYLF